MGKVIRRPQKSHKHLIKIPANTPAFIPKKLKFAEEIPIVGEEMQRFVVLIESVLEKIKFFLSSSNVPDIII